MSTPVTNFGKVTVSTGYTSGATSVVLASGHGSRLPNTFPFPLTWWDSTLAADPADDPGREIVTVTNRIGDTLTVTRGAESSGASNKNTAGHTYKMILGITKAMWEERRSASQLVQGLTMRTSPTSSITSGLIFIDAASIVMSDGEEVRDWRNVLVNQANSGAGGLDTGTLQPNTCYEVYALWDGITRSACLHRAKNYRLDVDTTASITEDATQGIGSLLDNSNAKVSQGFQLATAGQVPYIDVKVTKVGAPFGTMTFRIETDSGGKPSGTLVNANSSSLGFATSRLPTTATWIRIAFLNPPTLSAGVTYHVVAQNDLPVSTTDYIGWRMDGSAAGYTGGNKCLYDTDTLTWTADPDDDMLMRVYVTENDVDIASTAPPGNTYAFLGYMFTEGTPNLIACSQIGRRWRIRTPVTYGLLINETTGSTQMVDMNVASVCVPPLEFVNVTLSMTGTGAAAAALAFGSWLTPGITFGTTTGQELGLTVNFSTEIPLATGNMTIGYGLIYLDGTAGADLYLMGFDF